MCVNEGDSKTARRRSSDFWQAKYDMQNCIRNSLTGRIQQNKDRDPNASFSNHCLE